MRKFNYFLLSIMGLSIIGCTDLDENPQSEVSPDGFFNTVGNLESSLNGAYGQIANRFFLSRETGLTLMLRSDMVEISDPNTRAERINHNTLSDLADNNQTEVSWEQQYKIIAAANTTINGAETVSGSEEEINVIVAEARFLRAFTYYHLVRQFGDIPYFERVLTSEEAKEITKTSVADVYTEIVEDLEFAKQFLPDTQDTSSRASKAAAVSYLASVYLTMGEYQLAFDEAKEIIDNEGAYGVALESDFQNIFDSTVSPSSPEVIFGVQYIGSNELGDFSTDYLVPLTGIRADDQFGVGQEGWAVMVPPLAAFETWDNLDYRKTVSFNTTGLFQIPNPEFMEGVSGPEVPEEFDVTVSYNEPPTAAQLVADEGSIGGFNAFDSRNMNQPYIAKYTRLRGDAEGNGRASSHNYIFMRYAEVLLIAAEAAVEIGDAGSALTYVNRIRGRARAGGETVLSGQLAIIPASTEPADLAGVTVADVLEERRLELAFELKRWYDIARRELGDEVFSANGLEGVKSGFNAPEDYTIAIPAIEVSRNPNLGL